MLQPKTQDYESRMQLLKRQHEDEITVTSTVTPSSLLSSVTTRSAQSPEDESKTDKPMQFRIIDLAERCPPIEKCNSRAKRPGVEEEENGSAMAPRNVSYKRFPPQFSQPLTERACIVNNPQETKRQEMLEHCRVNRVSLRRAMSLLQVGSDAVQRAQHEQAISTLEEAAELLAYLKKPTARARCLDLLGQACSNSAQWNQSISHFFEAFLIREVELGRTHVDTINSLKHLGEVFLSSGNVRQARRCFAEVFWVQKAIFGTYHYCVAAAAHNLANAYDAEDNLLQAAIFYRTALEIYHCSGIHDSSATIQDLLYDLRRVQST